MNQTFKGFEDFALVLSWTCFTTCFPENPVMADPDVQDGHGHSRRRDGGASKALLNCEPSGLTMLHQLEVTGRGWAVPASLSSISRLHGWTG